MATVLILFVAATGAFAGGQGEGEEGAAEPRVLRVSTNHPEGTPASLGLEHLKEQVAELSSAEKAAFVDALQPLHDELSPQFEGLLERVKAVE